VLGYKVATVTYDSARVLNRVKRRRNLKMTLIADLGSRVIRAFGLLNEGNPPGSPAHGVAHPIVLVLDKNGTVTHRFSNANYTASPPLDLVLNVLRDREKS